MTTILHLFRVFLSLGIDSLVSIMDVTNDIMANKTSDFNTVTFGTNASNALNSSSPMNSSIDTYNYTTAAYWTVMPIFSIITFILGLIGNGIVLLLFAVDATLRTPFNCYLISLLIANLCLVIMQYSMDIVSNLYQQQWFLGDAACTVYLYAEYVIQGAMFNSHQLIALNRVWAAVHPLSYRSVHSMRIATLLCILNWVYVHAVVVPGWAADALYYRLPVKDNGCQLNAAAWPVWGLVNQLLTYDLPQARAKKKICVKLTNAN